MTKQQVLDMLTEVHSPVDRVPVVLFFFGDQILIGKDYDCPALTHLADSFYVLKPSDNLEHLAEQILSYHQP